MHSPNPPQPYSSRASQLAAGQARIPGDKSISHRALMLGAINVGRTNISGLLEGDDVLATAAALQQMGVSITRQANGDWQVFGVGTGGLHEPADILDMGNSGTSARLLSGLIASCPIRAILTGDASLRRRTMRRVMQPLERMGAEFIARQNDFLPMAIKGRSDLLALNYTLPVASAQVKSAILLAGLNTLGETMATEPTPTRDHTERMLRHFGVPIAVDNNQISLIGPVEITGQRHLAIPADISSAAFFMVANLLAGGGELRLEGVGVNPTRTGILDTLLEMGAEIKLENPRISAEEPVADIILPGQSRLRAVSVPASRSARMIDEYPILAMAAATADGTSHFHGLAELTHKESNRLLAIAEGLQQCGIRAEISGDSLSITGGAVTGGATIATRLDHRIAMSFLILGLIAEQPIAIDDARPITTSFPSFISQLQQSGANLAPLG